MEEEKQFRVPSELYGQLEVIAKKRGVTAEDAIKLLLTEFFEELKAKKEGYKYTMYLYDYGEKGFVVSMPAELPHLDPKHKTTKVIKIEMPKDARL